MNSLFCFMSARPEGGIPVRDWGAFRFEIIALLVLSILLGAAAIIGAYAWRTRKLAIRNPGDPFRLLDSPFWLRWVAWNLVPPLAMGILYFIRFRQRFSGIQVSPLACAFGAFLLTFLGCLLLFQVAVWVRGVTPPKFLYHPRWPWRLLARRHG